MQLKTVQLTYIIEQKWKVDGGLSIADVRLASFVTLLCSIFSLSKEHVLFHIPVN